jgi:hypothetical protein
VSIVTYQWTGFHRLFVVNDEADSRAEVILLDGESTKMVMTVVTFVDPNAQSSGRSNDIHVDSDSAGTLICNTFSGWRMNIFGAVQIDCVPLPRGIECHAYSAPTLTAQGGTLPYHWSLASGALPPGLSLSSAGAISGTATATGTFSFTVRLVHSTSPRLTATQAESITISPNCAAPVPAITPVKLPVTG